MGYGEHERQSDRVVQHLRDVVGRSAQRSNVRTHLTAVTPPIRSRRDSPLSSPPFVPNPSPATLPLSFERVQTCVVPQSVALSAALWLSRLLLVRFGCWLVQAVFPLAVKVAGCRLGRWDAAGVV